MNRYQLFLRTLLVIWLFWFSYSVLQELRGMREVYLYRINILSKVNEGNKFKETGSEVYLKELRDVEAKYPDFNDYRKTIGIILEKARSPITVEEAYKKAKECKKR